MKIANNWAATALTVMGVAFGFYMAIWVCFIGGVVDVIEAAKATPVQSLWVGIGLAKVFFSAPLGIFAAALFIVPAMFLSDTGVTRYRSGR